MLIELHPQADLRALKRTLQSMGLWTRELRPAGPPRPGAQLLIEPGSRAYAVEELRALPGVAAVWTQPSPHPRLDAQGPVVQLKDVAIGGPRPVLLAGPCSVESEEQIHQAAAFAAAAGARVLRGGAFKPRTSPYAFQGAGLDALRWLRQAADAHDLRVVTEIMAESHAEAVADAADLLQIGARNMQNFALLHVIGRLGKPALLKRGLAATLDEWLLAAEHLLDAGCPAVIFCERGIRHFDGHTRFLLDVATITLLRDVHGLPVIADPSHAAGRRDLIPRLALASLAAGASGVIIEAHPNPADACSDGPQQLTRGELLALGAMLGLTRAPCAPASDHAALPAPWPLAAPLQAEPPR
jgi:3-deoxy-7-phosphoheptulonate synthase